MNIRGSLGSAVLLLLVFASGMNVEAMSSGDAKLHASGQAAGSLSFSMKEPEGFDRSKDFNVRIRPAVLCSSELVNVVPCCGPCDWDEAIVVPRVEEQSNCGDWDELTDGFEGIDFGDVAFDGPFCGTGDGDTHSSGPEVLVNVDIKTVMFTSEGEMVFTVAITHKDVALLTWLLLLKRQLVVESMQSENIWQARNATISNPQGNEFGLTVTDWVLVFGGGVGMGAGMFALALALMGKVGFMNQGNQYTVNVTGDGATIGEHNTVTWTKYCESADLGTLGEELERLKAALVEDGGTTAGESAAEVEAAAAAARRGEEATLRTHLQRAGMWALGVADKIGVKLAADALKSALLGR